MPDEEIDRLREGALEIGAIFGPTHAEVREVIQESTKQRLAVGGIRSGVEDVRVPELINGPGGADFLRRIANVQRQEHSVEAFGVVTDIRHPRVFFDELPLDHRKVERGNPLEGNLQLRVSLDEPLCFVESQNLGSFQHLAKDIPGLYRCQS